MNEGRKRVSKSVLSPWIGLAWDSWIFISAGQPLSLTSIQAGSLPASRGLDWWFSLFPGLTSAPPPPQPSLLSPPTHLPRSTPPLTCFHGQHGDVVPASCLAVQPLAGHNGTRVRIDVEDLVQIRVAVNSIPEGGSAGLTEGVPAPDGACAISSEGPPAPAHKRQRNPCQQGGVGSHLGLRLGDISARCVSTDDPQDFWASVPSSRAITGPVIICTHCCEGWK